MLPSFAALVVNVIHPTVTIDSRNNRTFDYEHPERTGVLRGWRNPASTARTQGGEDVSEDAWLLYLPAGADVSVGCAVDVDGERWFANGAPQTWRSPTGALTHIQVPLVRHLPEEG